MGQSMPVKDEKIEELDWELEIVELTGVTYLSLDDAIDALSLRAIGKLGMDKTDQELKRFFYMHINGDEELLSRLCETVDYHAP